MDRLDEIRARFDAEPDWGVYDGALCRQDLAAILDEFSALRADLARVTAEKDAAKADLLYAMENSDSLMSCEPCTHRGYDPEDGMFCKLKSCRPEWRGPCPENGGTP